MDGVKRFFILVLIGIVLGLFFNVVEGHSQPAGFSFTEEEVEPESNICGLPPLNISSACCMSMAGDASSMNCLEIMAPSEGYLCWCTCEDGQAICGCGLPDEMNTYQQLLWGISRGRDLEQEVRI